MSQTSTYAPPPFSGAPYPQPRGEAFRNQARIKFQKADLDEIFGEEGPIRYILLDEKTLVIFAHGFEHLIVFLFEVIFFFFQLKGAGQAPSVTTDAASISHLTTPTVTPVQTASAGR